MRKFWFTGIIIYLLFSISNSINAQNEKFEALFIYNFTKYIHWPPSVSQEEFVIAIMGKSPIFSEMKQIATTKKVEGNNILIKEISSPNQVNNINILFIPKKSKLDLRLINNKVINNNTLVICECNGACNNGACLNFINKGGKLNFEISKKNIENNGLEVSSKLFSLGILVD